MTVRLGEILGHRCNHRHRHKGGYLARGGGSSQVSSLDILRSCAGLWLGWRSAPLRRPRIGRAMGGDPGRR
eukprot:5891858-Pyramimonas_sp.AAC.1